MDFIVSMFVLVLFIVIAYKIIIWIIGGIAESVSDFIYYSIHKHDDKQ